MKIAADLRVLSTPAADRGMGRYTRDVLEAILRTPGLELYAITYLRCQNEYVEELQGRGMKVLAAVDFAPADARWRVAQSLTHELDEILLDNGIDVFLDCSPFIGPGRLDLDARIAVVPIFYDLIPLFHQRDYLADFNRDALASYVLAARAVARADHVIAISGAVADDARHVLGVDPANVTLHYPALNQDYLRGSNQASQDLVPSRAFAVAVTGVHKSKGLKHLLAAYQELRKRQVELDLVVVLPEQWTLEHVMDEWDPTLSANVDLRVEVSEVEKVSLQKLAKFVVHPSVEEGFGIPMAEAIALGTPVVAAENPLNREIGSKSVCFFESGSPESLAAAMESMLTDAEKYESLREGSQADWALLKPKVSGHFPAAEVFEAAVGRARSRMAVKRYAVSGPLPPQVCGIADYTRDLVEAMSRDATVDVFVDSDGAPDLLEHKQIGFRPLSSLARQQEQYESISIQLGGAPWFSGQFEVLASRKIDSPWTTIHDYSMTLGMWDLWRTRLTHRSFLQDVVLPEPDEQFSRDVATVLSETDNISDLAVALNDVCLNAWIFEASEGVVSHLMPPANSVPQQYLERIKVLPMGVPDPFAVSSVRRRYRRNGVLVVGTFGNVVRTKLVEEVLEAVARVARLGVNISFRIVGPTPDQGYLAELKSLVSNLGIRDRVSFVSRVPDAEISEELASWDVGVTLRDPIRGGMSAALVRQLAVGMPVIMTDTADWDSIPQDAVERVPEGSTPEVQDEVAARLYRLCVDEARRSNLASNARRAYLENFSIETMASHYLELYT